MCMFGANKDKGQRAKVRARRWEVAGVGLLVSCQQHSSLSKSTADWKMSQTVSEGRTCPVDCGSQRKCLPLIVKERAGILKDSHFKRHYSTKSE